MRSWLGQIPLSVVVVACCLIPALPSDGPLRSSASQPELSSPVHDSGGATPASNLKGPNQTLPLGVTIRQESATNSTPIGEVGTVIGNLSGGTDPWGGFYEPIEGMVYATDFGAYQVTMIQGLKSRGVLPVGEEPIAGTYDAADGLDYISNYYDNNLSVYRGTIPQGSIAVRAGPWGMAYDPGNQFVYVANYGVGNVSLVQNHTVRAMIPVGNQPEGIVYDASNGLVYVVNHGSDNVSIISGQKVIANLPVGHDPEGATYDVSNGDIYVTNNYNGTVTVISGTSVVRTIRVGTAPAALAYDPGNGLVYVGNEGSGNLSILNSTGVVVTLHVGTCPYAVVYDPSDGAIYSMNCNPGTVYVISTMLGEASVTIAPVGDPVNSTDAGQTFAVTGNIWAVGTGDAAAFPVVKPSAGLSCSSMNFSVNSFAWANSSTNCNATVAGNYSVWVNVSDSLGSSVWARMNLRVYADAQLGGPDAYSRAGARIRSADVGQIVTFNTNATGGTGNYSGWRWFGFPLGACSGLDTPNPACVFAAPQVLSIQSGVVDTNGKLVTSQHFGFEVYPLPQVLSVTPKRAEADVGQSLNFVATTAVGAGGDSYAWNGTPSGCTGLNESVVHCRFAEAGMFNLTVQVTDADGGRSVPGPAALIEISPDPEVAAPVFSVSPAIAGGAENFSVAVVGGVGPYLYSWAGLPADCSGGSAQFSCVLHAPGTYRISATVTDANDFSVSSNVSVLVVNPAPNEHNASGTLAPRILGLTESSWIELSLGIVGVGLVGAWIVRRRRRAGGATRESVETEHDSEF